METIKYDFSVNLKRPILWEYEDAVNFISLIESKQSFYDSKVVTFQTDWHRLVWVEGNSSF